MKYIDLINKTKEYNLEDEAFIYLISEISNFTKSELYLNLQKDIEEDLLEKLLKAIDLYAVKNFPVQYIIGYTYFYGLKIMVNKNVLIPRFETEEVVEVALNIASLFEKPTIIDVGTGSGCISIALKKNLTDSLIYAIDISKEALEVAKVNATNNNADICFIENDLLSDISLSCDIIISNPPYIDPEEEVMSLVKNNEPHLALFSKNKGLYHYEQILIQSKKILKPNGFIIFEIAYNKKNEMIQLASKYYNKIEVKKDIRNNDRIMIIQGEK